MPFLLPKKPMMSAAITPMKSKSIVEAQNSTVAILYI